MNNINFEIAARTDDFLDGNGVETARILLITPQSSNLGENPIIAPAMGPYLLHRYLLNRGIASSLFDRDLAQPDVFLAQARSGMFDIIGFGVTHQFAIEDLELIWQFREAVEGLDKNVVFIGGGQEAALNYKQWLRLGIDLVFLGFAQKPLLEFCRRWQNDPTKVHEPQDFGRLTNGIPGVAYIGKGNREIYIPSAPVVQAEFEELFYDEVIGDNQFPYDAYWSKVRQTHSNTDVGAAKFVVENVRLYTTSHCPRKCGFCNSQSFLPESIGGKMPIISIEAENTAEIIRSYTQQYGALGFSFNDDDFLIGNKAGLDRVEDLCNRIIELKNAGEIPCEMTFACQTRVNNFITRDADRRRVANRPLLELLKRTGFRSISLGVESFIQRIIKAPSINKLGVTDQEQILVIDAMLDAGIVPQINLILGVPEYTPDELAQNLKIAFAFLKRGCDIGVTRRLYALPGAPIYGSPEYELVSKDWYHPKSGERFEIADYFVPADPQIRRVADRFDEFAKEELERTIKKWNWEGKLVHRRIVGLSSFIACARLLERHDLVETFRSYLVTLVDRRNQEMVVV